MLFAVFQEIFYFENFKVDLTENYDREKKTTIIRCTYDKKRFAKV